MSQDEAAITVALGFDRRERQSPALGDTALNDTALVDTALVDIAFIGIPSVEIARPRNKPSLA